MATASKKTGPIVLPELKRGIFNAYLMGDSPLISNAWSQKALTEILAKQMGQKLPRFPKSPVKNFLASIYRLQGCYAFPATAIKGCMVTACTSMNKEITKIAAMQAFFVRAEQGYQPSAFADLKTPTQLVRLYSPNAPQIREDAVRVGMGSADIRYRAEFWPWAMVVRIEFNRLVVTDATVAALIDTAGFAVGLGEWRQEKSGTYGSYHLADAVETKSIKEWMAQPQKEPEVPDEGKFIGDLLEAVRLYGEAVPDETAVAAGVVADDASKRRRAAAKASVQ